MTASLRLRGSFCLVTPTVGLIAWSLLPSQQFHISCHSLHENISFVQALDRFQHPNLCTEGFAQHKMGELGESLFRLCRFNYQPSWKVEWWILVCVRVIWPRTRPLCLSARWWCFSGFCTHDYGELSTISPHTRHRVPTRGERAQVPGSLPWWVRDCDSKVTGKVSVGHAELRSSIAT